MRIFHLFLFENWPRNCVKSQIFLISHKNVLVFFMFLYHQNLRLFTDNNMADCWCGHRLNCCTISRKAARFLPNMSFWSVSCRNGLSPSCSERRGVIDSLARAPVTGRLKLWPASDHTATGQSTQRQTGRRRPGFPPEDVNDPETKKRSREKHTVRR